MKYYLTLLCFLCTLPVSADILPSNDIFSNANYQSLSISPNGEYTASKLEIDGRRKIIAFKSSTLNALEIFDIPINSGKNYIYQYGWIDNNTLYVNYVTNKYTRPLRIIKFKFKDEDFDIETFDFKITGKVIHSMPSIENNILFSIANSDSDGYNLYQLNVNSLENRTKKEQKKYLRSKDRLNVDFSNAVAFWIDSNYKLNMVKEETETETSYYVKNNNGDSWTKFYTQLKKETEEVDNEDINKIFKPVGVIDDNNIIVISNENRDKAAVVSYNTSTKTYGKVYYESSYYDITSAKWNDEEKELKYVFYVEKGANKVKYLDDTKNNQHAFLKDKLKSEGVYIVDSSLDEKSKIIYTSDSGNAGKYYLYNSDSKKIRFLQDSYPSLYDFEFSKGQYINTKNKNGHLLEGFLYSPTTDKNDKHPLIVMPHGGPIGVQDLNEFDKEVQFLVNRGYAVLKINFRGSSGYGKQFKNSGRGEFGKGIEEDINMIVEKAVAKPFIDQSRLCIYGQSYGGYSALISSIINPKKYKCAVSAFGITDLPLTFASSNIHKIDAFQNAIKRVIGDIDKDYTSLVENSPLYQAEKLNIPVLLFAGKRDETAIFDHSNRLKFMLEHYNKDVQLITYQSGHGHPYWYGDRHQYLTLIDFFDEHLGIKRSYTEKDKRVLAKEYFFLGEMHRTGAYVGKDTKKAEKFLRLAHIYGHDEAAKQLRKMGVYDLNKK
jgi:dipeptidyl aminopeptidase/acylaminoacyl peptidase